MSDTPIPIAADDGVSLPAYATAGAAGVDLRAHLPGGSVLLVAGARALIPTGIRLALPAGFEAQVRPRSGLALKFGITVLNSPGTIDEDYRGEVQVLLINHGADSFEVKHGERIAQMVIAPYTRADWQRVEAEELTQTARGAGGYGHTGTL